MAKERELGDFEAIYYGVESPAGMLPDQHKPHPIVSGQPAYHMVLGYKTNCMNTASGSSSFSVRVWTNLCSRPQCPR